MLRTFIEQCAGDFAWMQAPYEYDYSTLPIKLIGGAPWFDEALQASEFDLDSARWVEGQKAYIEAARSSLLYERNFGGKS